MEYILIKTIVASVVSAFLFGYIAQKLRFPRIVGYMLAGVAIGPYTPGILADIGLAKQLAEIGIILLMFGVGLHFSIQDLKDVRKVALPGALFQMLFATTIGALIVRLYDFSWLNAIVFGFSLSVASTVVLLRALERRRELTTDAGKIAIGWLIVEDIAMVLAIVLLPAVGSIAGQVGDLDTTVIFKTMGTVVVKIAIFASLMIIIGRRVLPWLLVGVARTKSRELSSLAILAIALGFSYVAYTVFGASFALGAFLAGLVLNESAIGQKAADQSLPMRDTFAVLFFVSVGMLFDPMALINHPVLVILSVLTITVGKAAAAWVIMWMFRQKPRSSAIISASLAQIGEFSFIFAGMGLALGLLPDVLHNVVLASALLSIGLNHFIFQGLEAWFPALEQDNSTQDNPEADQAPAYPTH